MSKQSAKTEETVTLLKTWPQVFFFYFIGLSLFFITAFIVVTLRISHKGDVHVPSLVGKTYLEVHNHLQKNGYEVKLKNVYSTNYPYGYIISQSLSPGEIVKIGQKITLLVNRSKNIIKTPTLIGFLESLAPKILGNVHSGERRFRLLSGVITHINSEKPRGVILAQYPLPETPVPPEYPISYLVSRGTSTKAPIRASEERLNNEDDGKKSLSRQQKKQAHFKIERMIDELDLNKKMLNIEIVKAISYYMKIPLEIDQISIDKFEHDSLVLEYRLSNDVNNDQKKIWKVNVGYYDKRHPEGESAYPFQFVWVNHQTLGIDQGMYTIAQRVRAQSDRVTLQDEPPLSGLAYVSLKKDQLFPIFKTFSDEFLIWNGYHTMSELITHADKKLKLPDEIYSPENFLP